MNLRNHQNNIQRIRNLCLLLMALAWSIPMALAQDPNEVPPGAGQGLPPGQGGPGDPNAPGQPAG
ncbi:MAG: hypothetical protein ACK48K_14775, partial [Planctomycetota bacterium]